MCLFWLCMRVLSPRVFHYIEAYAIAKKSYPWPHSILPQIFWFPFIFFLLCQKQTNRKVNKKQKRILLGIVAAAARQFFWILELSGSKTFHIFETTATYIYSTSPDSHPYKKLFLKKVQIFKETKKQENHMIVFK